MVYKLPSVNVIERESPAALDTFIANISASYVVSRWGDNSIKVVRDEIDLVNKFGANKNNSISLQTAASYLKISNGLELVRVVPDTARNANSKDLDTLSYKNTSSINNAITSLETEAVTVISKCVGQLGDSLKVVLVDNTNWDESKHGSMFVSEPSTSPWANEINYTNDEVHVAVIDTKGEFSNAPNTVLERFEFLSKAKNATSTEYPKNYFVNVVNDNSNYVYLTKVGYTVVDKDASIGDDVKKETTAKEFDALDGDNEFILTKGLDGTVTVSDIIATLNKFSSDVGTLSTRLFLSETLNSASYATIVKHANSVAKKRGNLVIFRSPKREDVVGDIADNVKIDRLKSSEDTLALLSSYCAVDDNWGLTYNGASNNKLYIPMCGITCALWTKAVNNYNIHTSAAGTSRGVVNSILSLACNIDRDLYSAYNVNSYINLSNGGIVLFGDRTCYKRKSPYRKIGTRMLINAIKDIIKRNASSVLFEGNDNNIRLRFISKVSQLLNKHAGEGAFNTNNNGGLESGYLVIANPPTQLELDNDEFNAQIIVYPKGSIEKVTIAISALNSTINFKEI